MITVFVAGSIKIKKLDPLFVERVKKIVSAGHRIIIGDAKGVDSSIQYELYRQKARNVLVYCSGSLPRNNVGNWSVKAVSSSSPEGTRAFFTAKDHEMARDADFGLMLWDAASAGTLSNVFELVKLGKKCVVFVNKDRDFINVKSPDDVYYLVSAMSEGAKVQAEQKIGLRARLDEVSNTQFGLQF